MFNRLIDDDDVPNQKWSKIYMTPFMILTTKCIRSKHSLLSTQKCTFELRAHFLVALYGVCRVWLVGILRTFTTSHYGNRQ